MRKLLGGMVVLTALLTGCGGGGTSSGGNDGVPAGAATTYSIGGTVTGLTSGQSVTLQDNGADSLTVSADGDFTFATPVAANGSYSVTVSSQPAGQTCSVAANTGSGSGVVANVNSVQIVCSSDSYVIGGSVSGLSGGSQVTLLNNGSDALTLQGNGSFTFATPVARDGSYVVTISAQPAGQTCTVSNGTGAGVTAAVSSVAVTCSTETYTIGGNVSGLATGQQVTLKNNGGDALTLSGNGPFTFATPVAYGGSYAVTVGTQPTGQICSVSNGAGNDVTAPVGSVVVSCSSSAYTVGGTITGLNSGGQVTLLNNGADPVTVTANGTFAFPTPVSSGGTYAVTVGTQPSQQYCSIASGAGTVSGTVTGVQVACGSNLLVLHSFTGNASDGSAPQAGLVMDSAGNLYGTTLEGGSNNDGTVFKLAPDGSGGYTESIIHNFAGGSDGQYPMAALVVDSGGNLYGTTSEGGSNSNGTLGVIFKLAPDGSGGYTETILHSFSGVSDGGAPGAGLIMDSSGNLYGTTQSGGGSSGIGTVFRIAADGSNFITLHIFTGTPSDGGASIAPLAMDSQGNLYGTTQAGGSANLGTVFKLTLGGNGGYTESILHNFTGGADGQDPKAGVLVDAAGNLYGTTAYGGSGTPGPEGVVFKLGTDGSNFTVLHNFGNGDDGGGNSFSGLIMDDSGTLYGMTKQGGLSAQNGTVFSLAKDGSNFTLLHIFNYHTDGADPYGNLIMDSAGNLYGTASTNGPISGAMGTAFKIELH